MLIDWRDEYNVGIKKIDEQHQGLVDTLNKLYELVNRREFSDDVESLIEDLIKYTEEHFSLEEKYFDKFNYENKKSHKKAHDFFEEKILSLKTKYLNEEIKTSFDLVDYLEDWFLEHITGEDREYIELFKEKGLS